MKELSDKLKADGWQHFIDENTTTTEFSDNVIFSIRTEELTQEEIIKKYKTMTNTEIIKKLIGSIKPIGKSEIDSERFENLKALCELVNDLVTEIDNVVYDNRDAYEASVVRAREYASKFLTQDLGIPYVE